MVIYVTSQRFVHPNHRSTYFLFFPNIFLIILNNNEDKDKRYKINLVTKMLIKSTKLFFTTHFNYKIFFKS